MYENFVLEGGDSLSVSQWSSFKEVAITVRRSVEENPRSVCIVSLHLTNYDARKLVALLQKMIDGNERQSWEERKGVFWSSYGKVSFRNSRKVKKK